MAVANDHHKIALAFIHLHELESCSSDVLFTDSEIEVGLTASTYHIEWAFYYTAVRAFRAANLRHLRCPSNLFVKRNRSCDDAE